MAVTLTARLPVLNNAQHPHEGFSAAKELEQKLRSVVRGEVRFDPGSRALYATDASNYRQVPIGLVIPRDVDDVIAAVSICREVGAPVLARGGGTSLAGQCCNVAVVLDFSKYMRNIHWLDAEKKQAHVEPGIVLDRVREAAEEHHLTFAPDPATHNRCTLGGMIGNNSCGVHALMGGKTVDNIHSLDVLLYDGTRMTVGPTSEDELSAIITAGGRKGEIYAGLRRIRDQYADLIRQRFPRIPRRVSGYNLDELLPENGFNVARALVGTEGTCVIVLGATLELMPSPPHRRLVGLGFADPFIAADYVPFVLEHKPIGLEGFDGMLVDFMRRKRLALDDIALLPEGRGHLLVEFGGWSPEDVEAQVRQFLEEVKQIPGQARRYSEPEAPRVWHVRESALGSTVFVPGEPHGWEGWEDSAVPPEKLGAYLRDIFHLMDEFSYRTPMYGHFGQGCVHMRINFDLESEEGIGKFRVFLDRATDVVLKYGGSISGEHGDGQARGALLPKMFGPELMQAFGEFKSLWDPENRMNPGKMIDPVAVYGPHENLRLGAGYKSVKPVTYFQFPEDKGSFGEATLRCVGVGACRKQNPGTMCPSYMATQEEMHSTRGRAHLLWEALEGHVLEHGWGDEHVREALDLCLSCKACKSECPVNVDIATYKAEFLAHYYEKHRHALRDYAFGFMDRWAHLASAVPGVTTRLANLPLQVPGVSSLIKSILGIAPQRRLPCFAPRSYQSSLAQSLGNGQVFLWPDTWNNYYHPQVLAAARQVLADAGFSAYTPRQHICCGRPLYDFGFLKHARAYLETVLSMFAREIDSGMPFIFLEPSCASVMRDELLNFFPTNERAKRLSEQALLLSEFLAQRAPEYRPPSLAGKRIVLHGHCHHKSLMKMKDEVAILKAAGADVELLDSGCCGMAGPFGFEKEKYDVSQMLGERVLLPAVRHAAAETLIVSNGFSCREQIAQNSSRRALHFAEVLGSQ
ncbi:MAG TPA: FAD-binding and (Fe-S)-binding domain-containing protein [Pseudacidobacterium sp.]|nr:FAD-binding and (Fe-S)-binding domain-containing protein [Pseudacidobacterium sp.]